MVRNVAALSCQLKRQAPARLNTSSTSCIGGISLNFQPALTVVCSRNAVGELRMASFPID